MRRAAAGLIAGALLAGAAPAQEPAPGAAVPDSASADSAAADTTAAPPPPPYRPDPAAAALASFRLERSVDVETVAFGGADDPAVAPGFQTLADNTEVHYLVSEPYSPPHYRGVRWDDPAFGIQWPDAPERLMHDRDRTYADFRDENAL